MVVSIKERARIETPTIPNAALTLHLKTLSTKANPHHGDPQEGNPRRFEAPIYSLPQINVRLAIATRIELSFVCSSPLNSNSSRNNNRNKNDSNT